MTTYTGGGQRLMAAEFGDAWVDGLGARLRLGIAAGDREAYRAYSDYLNDFRISLEAELRALAPGRVVNARLKRLETVAAKLRRRPELALSKMLDIVGIRIIASNRDDQAAIAGRINASYDVRQVDDKSDNPRFGYRAVHFDIRYRGANIEIQVQTRNQHLWQGVSEQAAGYDIAIKYGGGHPDVGRALLELSELAWRCDVENTELPNADIDRAVAVIISVHEGESIPDTAEER